MLYLLIFLLIDFKCDTTKIRILKDCHTRAFFLCRVEICQKDIVENHSKILVLKKKQN